MLLDNGRSRVLATPFRESLQCIRCGACLNACPVYRRIGGHAYGGVYSGPIGSILTPLYDSVGANPHLPHASSLCGACQAACPVKINIPHMLIGLREMQVRGKARKSPLERLAYALSAAVLRRPWLYRLALWAARLDAAAVRARRLAAAAAGTGGGVDGGARFPGAGGAVVSGEMEGIMNKQGRESRVIKFYGTGGDHGCFSNFAHYPIRLHGRIWPTVEHFFQAQKFPDSDYEETIRLVRFPAKAKGMGRTRRFRLRRDWEQVKDGIMREAVLAKFTQHEDVRAVLLATGDAVIVEDSPTDDYCGRHGGGKNKLGKILDERPRPAAGRRRRRMTTERDRFLQRVRQAVADGNRAGAVPELPVRGNVGYQGAGADPVARFRAECTAAGGFVHIVADAAAAADAVDDPAARAPRPPRPARQRRRSRFPGSSRPTRRGRRRGGRRLPPADEGRRGAFFAADAGVSGVDCLVAETGSVVLLTRPDQPRSLSLLPPLHVAVADRSQLLPDLFDLFELPSADPPSCLSLITGPSKTGDIAAPRHRGPRAGRDSRRPDRRRPGGERGFRVAAAPPLSSCFRRPFLGIRSLPGGRRRARASPSLALWAGRLTSPGGWNPSSRTDATRALRRKPRRGDFFPGTEGTVDGPSFADRRPAAGRPGLVRPAAAKPPDLPLEDKDVLTPQDPLAPAETAARRSPTRSPRPPKGQSLRDGRRLAERVAPSPFFPMRPSARRMMASCLLFGVHPLLTLTPTEDYVDVDDDDG